MSSVVLIGSAVVGLAYCYYNDAPDVLRRGSVTVAANPSSCGEGNSRQKADASAAQPDGMAVIENLCARYYPAEVRCGLECGLQLVRTSEPEYNFVVGSAGSR